MTMTRACGREGEGIRSCVLTPRPFPTSWWLAIRPWWVEARSFGIPGGAGRWPGVEDAHLCGERLHVYTWR